ncbi:MAG: 50S ribosomal protein L7Ae [archaeon]
MTAPYQDFEVPEELSKQIYEAVEKARDTGKIKQGVNEVTKALERKNAELVIIATDIKPPEIVAHIPILSKEKEIPYTYVPSQKELGLASGINVGSSAIAITKAGESKKEIEKIKGKIEELKKE